MRIDILGVGFDALTMEGAAAAADALLQKGEGGSIVTVNPEILLHSRKDSTYAAALNGADLVLADGVGDLYAAWILGTPLPERVTGADLTPRLLSRLAGRGGSVFLYGGKPGVAARAAERLAAAYPGLRIAGTENGYISDEDELFSRLSEAPPSLLLLGLGFPRQELWMAAHRDLSTVMIGIGGLLDVFAGDLARAPKFWRRAGLEWLYRLFCQPERLPRMIKLPGILFLAAAQRIKKSPRGGGQEG